MAMGKVRIIPLQRVKTSKKTKKTVVRSLYSFTFKIMLIEVLTVNGMSFEPVRKARLSIEKTLSVIGSSNPDGDL